ncbi:hypothetical protein [Allokutzneria sp. NRRL B-24872]|uniref:hypothetical protein n=1 Tax=Allokutzneria sp. NRRL B-24872 TaxID=1137961 RepID=UPI000A3CD421|nr:hypothetical protein [Allokutzneria sp. NRRL B-24872]
MSRHPTHWRGGIATAAGTTLLFALFDLLDLSARPAPVQLSGYALFFCLLWGAWTLLHLLTRGRLTHRSERDDD